MISKIDINLLKQYIQKNLVEIVIFGIFFIISYLLFFQNLGALSLGSWDEAWYADIARNILIHKNPFFLTWNDQPFSDHPPAVFWLMSLSFLVFGISEISARIVSATSGFFCLILVYLLGKEIFLKKWVGFLSAVALCTAPWFVYRSRSGNLDIPLTLFFMLSFYFALKLAKDDRFKIPFIIATILLILSKTIVPFTILPSLIIIFWSHRRKLFKIQLLMPLLLFIGWFLSQSFFNPLFLKRFLMIGLPGVGIQTSFLDNLKLAKEYLHSGIGKWFWPSIMAIPGGFFLKNRHVLALSIFCVVFLSPFLFSSKGQIWHMIPVFPFLILGFFGVFLSVCDKFFKLNLVMYLIILIISGIFLGGQIQYIWDQMVNVPGYISDEAILSREASKYSEDFYIDGEFLPAAVYYSQKKVVQIKSELLSTLFRNEPHFLLITDQGRLNEAGVLSESYRILKKDRDKLLIQKL